MMENTISSSLLSNIEKQMAALRGDDSEEGRARLAKLQTQLDEANQDLRDTEYDKYISDQQDMLDQLLKEYSDIMERLQKDENYMINHGFKEVNGNLEKMQESLNGIAESWKYAQSNDYKKTEDAVKEDVKNGGIDDYNPNNIITSSGKTESNAVTDVVNKDSDKLVNSVDNPVNVGISNDYSTNGSSWNGSLNDGGGWEGSLNKNPPVPSNNIPNYEDDYIKTNHGTDPNRFIYNGQVSSERDHNAYLEKQRTALLNAARSFIGANAQKAKKDYKDLSYVNQKIYKATDGKVLSTENLKKLAKNTLKVEYDNAGKDGNLAKKMKEIQYTGFRTGGIAELMPKGEDGLAWVRNGEGFVSPENVEYIKKLLEVTPDMQKFINGTTQMEKTTNVMNQATYGDVSFNFELPNVTDRKDLLRTIQNDRSIQRAIKILAWEEPLGLNKYAVNMIR